MPSIAHLPALHQGKKVTESFDRIGDLYLQEEFLFAIGKDFPILPSTEGHVQGNPMALLGSV